MKEKRGKEGGRERGRRRKEGRDWVGMRVSEKGKGGRQKKWKGWEETSTTLSLLEDLSQRPVSLDAVYILSDDGFLFVSSLLFQPLHHSLIVVPQVCLQGGQGQSMALPHRLVNTLSVCQ